MRAGDVGRNRSFRPILLLAMLPILVRTASGSLAPDKPIHQFMLQNWQSQQGLPQNSVLAIAQTPNGYLWLGTEEGLARFDGIRFSSFDSQKSGLDQNTVQTLLVDRKGTLWAGTQGGGLNRLDGEKFHTFNATSGLPQKPITSLFEDASGVLWIGTDGGGLVRMQAGEFKIFDKQNGLADNSVFSITEDRQKNLWIGTHGGLSRFSSGRFTNFDNRNGLPSNFVRVVRTDRQGHVWVGTPSGLCRFSTNSEATFTQQDTYTNNSIYSIFEDRAGTLWIGQESGGLARIVNGKFTSYVDDTGFLVKNIWSIFEDREGSLWVGTTGRGLTCLKQGRFSTFTKKDNLASNIVLSVLEDKEGALWMGSDSGLMKREKDRTTLLTVENGLPHNMVLSLAEDRDGAIWAGTKRGLAQIRSGKVVPFNMESELPTDPVMALYTDRAGTLWMGTRNGLIHLEGSKVTIYTTKDGLSSNHVVSIEQDRTGAFWIGTFGGGLNRFEKGTFHAYTTRDGLSSNVVYAIYCDGKGVIWLATNNGLNRLEEGRIDNFTASRDLYQDAIFHIMEDARGFLWLSSNRGVFRYSKQQLNDFTKGRVHEIATNSYDTADGMSTRECNGGFQPSGWKGKDGRLYLPTVDGLVFTNGDPAAAHDAPLQTVLEQVTINEHDYPLDRILTIPPGKGRLQFQFTAPSFIRPEKLRFRYMLEGFDKDWVQAGTQRTAYYTNIPHGDYRFHVQVADAEGWQSQAASKSITLQPHLYQTKIFYFIILFSTFTICTAAYRIRMDQLRQRERRLMELVDERTAALRESERQLRQSRDGLEIRVQERTQELTYANQALGEEVETRRRAEGQLIIAKESAEAANRAKTQFLTNISHEIRTPINGILGMTELTLTTSIDEEQKEYLEIVKVSADSLLAIVNNLLDYSQMEQNVLTLRPSKFRLKALVNDLARSFTEKAKEKNLSFTCTFAEDAPDSCMGDSLRLGQVLTHLLDNAIKFTQQGGISLICQLARRDDSIADVHFMVQDTGIGIAPDQQKAIFDAFNQADNSLTRRYGGTGIGLAISYRFAVMMGGSIWVESEENKGSTFHFTARLTLAPSMDEADMLAASSAVPV